MSENKISRGRYPHKEKGRDKGVAMDIVRGEPKQLTATEAWVALPASSIPVTLEPGAFEVEELAPEPAVEAPLRRFPMEAAAPVSATPAAMGTFEAVEDPAEARITADSGKYGGKKNPINLKIYTIAELVALRDEITQELPAIELSKINLEEEVLLQYHTLRELQGDVLSDDQVPTNQKAQVANSVAASLKTMGDQQVALYSSERFKEVENLLVRSLRLWPEETAAVFLEEYTQILRKHKQ